MKDSIIILTGIMIIGFLEGLATIKGIDGALRALAFAFIGFLVGYKLKGLTKFRGGNKNTNVPREGNK